MSKTHAKTHSSIKKLEKEKSPFRKKALLPPPPHPRQVQGPKPKKAWDPLRCRDLVVLLPLPPPPPLSLQLYNYVTRSPPRYDLVCVVAVFPVYTNSPPTTQPHVLAVLARREESSKSCYKITVVDVNLVFIHFLTSVVAWAASEL